MTKSKATEDEEVIEVTAEEAAAGEAALSGETNTEESEPAAGPEANRVAASLDEALEMLATPAEADTPAEGEAPEDEVESA